MNTQNIIDNTLSLNNIEMDEDDVQKVVKALESTILHELYLYSNNIKNNGIVRIAKALVTNTSLHTFWLTYNRHNRYYENVVKKTHLPTSKCAIELAQMLRINCNLKELNLTGNKLGINDIVEIVDALKENSTLATLDLSDNMIMEKGCIALSNMLRVNSTLKSLTLLHYIPPFGSIKVIGAIEIARALKMNCTLEILNLKCNGIGDEGVIELAHALEVNSTLRKLDLGCNQISDKGVIELAYTLKVNNTLQCLNLDFNDFSYGVIELANALKINNSLRELYLSNTQIKNDYVIKVVDILQDNYSLLKINTNYQKDKLKILTDRNLEFYYNRRFVATKLAVC